MVFEDTNARAHWGWNPKYDMKRLVEKMFIELRKFQAADKIAMKI